MNRVKKFLIDKFIIFLVAVSTFVCNTTTCFAHPTQAEHYKELEQVLFVEGYSKNQSAKIKKAIQNIEYAQYLCVDQFGGKGKKKQYKSLKKQLIVGFPMSFSSIDYDRVITDKGESSKQVNANTHRQYTHQGWAREYNSKYVDKFMEKRDQILLSTVNSVFDNFDSHPLVGSYDKQCDALCALIYYVHILGDYEEADKYSKIPPLIPLAGASDNWDICYQLEKYLPKLFKTSKKTQKQRYDDLMSGIKDIDERASNLYRSTGGPVEDGEFAQYHQCADDLMTLLKEKVPYLLKDEPFFKKVFYPGT